MHLYELVYDGQAYAQPALRAVQGSRALNEKAEYKRHQVRRDSDAGIADGDYRVRLLAARFHPDLAALIGVLDGVGQEVRDTLNQASVVPVYI